jgi:uncharacterized protein
VIVVISVSADPNVLLLGFAFLMLVVAGLMARRLRRSNPADAGTEDDPDLGAGPAWPARRVAIFIATGTGIGFLTGLFGVGGGIIVVPILVLVLGFRMPIAVGTSIVVIILNSLAAMAARLGTDVPIDWPLIATFTAGAVVGSLAGNRIAGRADTRRLTQAFIVLIVVVSAYTAGRSLLELA